MGYFFCAILYLIYKFRLACSVHLVRTTYLLLEFHRLNKERSRFSVGSVRISNSKLERPGVQQSRVDNRYNCTLTG